MAHVGEKDRLRLRRNLGAGTRLTECALGNFTLTKISLNRSRHAVDGGRQRLHLFDPVHIADSFTIGFSGQRNGRTVQHAERIEQMFLQVAITGHQHTAGAEQQENGRDNPVAKRPGHLRLIIAGSLVDHGRKRGHGNREIGPQAQVGGLMQQLAGKFPLRLGFRNKLLFVHIVKPLRCRKGNLFGFLHSLGDLMHLLHQRLLAGIKTEPVRSFNQWLQLAAARRHVVLGTGYDLLPIGRRQILRARLGALAYRQDVVVINQKARIGGIDIGTDEAPQQINFLAHFVHQHHGLLTVLGNRNNLVECRQRTQGNRTNQQQHRSQREGNGKKCLTQIHRARSVRPEVQEQIQHAFCLRNLV